MRIIRTAERVTWREEGFFSVETGDVPLRIWFLTDDILRVRAGFDGSWDEASYALTLTAWESRTDALLKDYREKVHPAAAALSEEADRFVLQGARLRVEIGRSPFALAVYDADGTLLHADAAGLPLREDRNGRRIHNVEITAEDHFYGFGEKSGALNKAGRRLVMSMGDAFAYDPAETDPLYKHIPFYIRLNGMTGAATGYFYDCPAPCAFDLGRERHNYWPFASTFRADSGDVDLFFIAGPQIADVLCRYTALTGRPAMLPRQALGYLGSSMYYVELPRDCDDGILDFVDTAEREGMPMDGFQMSSGYCNIETEQGLKRCTFTWNPERFRDPAAWLREMKMRGVPVTANIKPGMLLVHPRLAEMKARGVFVRASEGDAGEDGFAIGAWWGGKGLFFDFTDARARACWKELVTEQLLTPGCTSIWNDNCEYDNFVDADARVSFEGQGGAVGDLGSVMGSLMAHIAVEAIREHDPDERPYVLNRAGYAGIQRYAQTWAGDNRTSWETLRCNVATMLGMSLSGVANQGCDVGGFAGEAPDAELLVRWVQNGIFMPRFSIHSTNPDNTVTEPWMYSGVREQIRDAMRFRRGLLPLLYALEARAHETGLPILAPAVLAFQEDRRTWEEDTEFLLGDDLLVANVLEPGAKTRRVYLPAARPGQANVWYDFYTRVPYTGGQEIELPVTLSSIPLFVRGGAVLPLAEDRDCGSAPFSRPVTALRLLLAPDADGRFTLYEDDGVSNDYERGVCRRTTVAVRAGARTEITFTHQGEYPTAVEYLLLDVIHRERAPLTVSLREAGATGERGLVHFLNRTAFESSAEGWYYSASLRSAQIKYANPKGDHTVTVAFEERDMIGM